MLSSKYRNYPLLPTGKYRNCTLLPTGKYRNCTKKKSLTKLGLNTKTRPHMPEYVENSELIALIE